MGDGLAVCCWLRDSKDLRPGWFTASLSCCVHQVPLGVYSAVGVKAVHQDLQDAGVSFEVMEERSVVIHDQCFSPENAMLQLDDEYAGWSSIFFFFWCGRGGGGGGGGG